MTLSVMTLSVMTLSIEGSFVKLSINNIQHIKIGIMLNVIMPIVALYKFFIQNVVMLSVIKLSVVAP